MKIQQRCSLSLFLAAALLFPSQLLLGTDVSFYGILKVQEFAQTNDSAPTLDGATPFSFYCFADATAPDVITNAFVQLPGGGSRTLEPDGSQYFEWREFFSSLSALNSTYGAGVYTLNIESVNDGTNVVPLTVPADAFPGTPQITNHTAAQSVNPSNEFVLGWLPFDGGTVGDFVQVEIQTSGGDEVFFSGEPGEPEGLNGTNTFIVIPANTFYPGESYRAKLGFYKFVSTDTTSIPNADGVVAFGKQTEFNLQTTGTPPTIHLQILGFTNGNFQFSFNTQPGKNYQVQVANSLPNWSDIGFTNATSTEVIFTDPFAGSSPARFYRVLVP